MTTGEDQDLTRQLRDWAQGNAEAADTLVPLVYAELRRMAGVALSREAVPPTAATSLVHDLFVRLATQRQIDWKDRGHFFAIAARMLRQLLVARARRRNTLKRGGGQVAEPITSDLAVGQPPALSPEELISLDRALDTLATIDPDRARLVELRYFAGLSLEETAETLGVSLATVKRHWDFARRWLHREISGTQDRAD
ncbi:MAG: sigma-70 family RNA polymerase sigma factor [Bryobacterales bacterium]|nr:sigma-70 family RNA polymerase sigma factor [Bryobacterales bacterium]